MSNFSLENDEAPNLGASPQLEYWNDGPGEIEGIFTGQK
jgi:hypothetical protein